MTLPQSRTAEDAPARIASSRGMSCRAALRRVGGGAALATAAVLGSAATTSASQENTWADRKVIEYWYQVDALGDPKQFGLLEIDSVSEESGSDY